MIKNLKESRKSVLKGFESNRLNSKQLRMVSGGKKAALASCTTGSSDLCDNTAVCNCKPPPDEV